MIAGPFCGELGWELMRWQGHLRYLGAKVVFCEKGHEYLYQDFAEVYQNEMVSVVRNKWMPTEEHSYYYIPSKKICEAKHLKQKFIQYGTEGKTGYDVVIHARNLGKPHPDWPNEKWLHLQYALHGCSVAYVGSVHGARAWFSGGEDKRGIGIEDLCDIMRNSKLFIGESSGPAHLASLCGLSHLVITDRKKWNLGGKKGRNWTRYTDYWNPLGTPAYVLDQDNYDPPVDKVLRAIEKNGLL